MTASLLLLLVLTPAEAAPVSGKVALLPPHDRAGQELEDSEGVVNVLAQALAPLEGVERLSAVQVREALDTMKAGGLRCQDAKCFARIGLFTGADVVIVPIQTQLELRLRRIGVEDERMVADIAVGPGEGGLQRAARQLLTGLPSEGRVRVTELAVGTELFIQDRAIVSPSEALVLPVGEHELTFRRGSAEAKLVIVVRSAETTEVRAPPLDAPPLDAPPLDAPPLDAPPLHAPPVAPPPPAKPREDAPSPDGRLVPEEKAEETTATSPGAPTTAAPQKQTPAGFWLAGGVLAGTAMVTVVTGGASLAGLLIRVAPRESAPADVRNLGGAVSSLAGASALVVLLLGATASASLVAWGLAAE